MEFHISKGRRTKGLSVHTVRAPVPHFLKAHDVERGERREGVPPQNAPLGTSEGDLWRSSEHWFLTHLSTQAILLTGPTPE